MPSPTTATPTKPISVLVVDDHEVAREGVISGLGKFPDIGPVHAATSIEEALSIFTSLHPDVVIADYSLDGGTAPELIGKLHGLDPQARTIVLSVHVDNEFILAALHAGALAYVPKATTLASLAETVRKVAGGKEVLEGVTAGALMSLVRADPGKVIAAASAVPATPPLSPRELEVIAAVSEGMTNREIAEQLGLSDLTVKTHVSRIFSKLGARDRASAATIALRARLI